MLIDDNSTFTTKEWLASFAIITLVERPKILAFVKEPNNIGALFGSEKLPRSFSQTSYWDRDSVALSRDVVERMLPYTPTVHTK